MKRLVILGSTGSIGTQTLDIVKRLPGRFQILGLAANNNVKLLAEQADSFDVPCVSMGTATLAEELRARLRALGRNTRVLAGVEGMCEVATLPEADLVVVAVAGAIGIAPTHAALEAGKDIALASKEVLVAAGEPTMALARARGAKILPIDSEHSAIFQCLQGAPEKSLERIYLTASGGPFRTVPQEALAHVTPEQALKHPTWNMGGLVTINSATLMNKSLEIIEAHWLFDVPVEAVEVVVHPQSIVHSMVRYKDGSTIAQLGLPDMRLPIQYALVYPERPDTGLPRMELEAFAHLTFEAPDEAKFPALGLARRAAAQGGTMPAVMNAANEAAVGLFLHRKIAYLDIMRLVAQTMERHDPVPPTLANILEADAWARNQVAAHVD
ncbi:MAG TPA: 1-deoxy-D-xylulose-5-phosphate reductoisomerase [Chthonomonadaceae bacterium]|nr:1-deoxy-D-xylulose-5-phosphate reductoisomerase [Chthonomonadaceae bacterium]